MVDKSLQLKKVDGVGNNGQSSATGGGINVDGFKSLFTIAREKRDNSVEAKQANQIASITSDKKENAIQIADLTTRMQGFSEDSDEYKIIKDILVGLKRRGEELDKQLAAVNPYVEISSNTEVNKPKMGLNFEC